MEHIRNRSSQKNDYFLAYILVKVIINISIVKLNLRLHCYTSIRITNNNHKDIKWKNNNSSNSVNNGNGKFTSRNKQCRDV